MPIPCHRGEGTRDRHGREGWFGDGGGGEALGAEVVGALGAEMASTHAMEMGVIRALEIPY